VLLIGWQNWQIFNAFSGPILSAILGFFYFAWHSYGYAQLSASLKKQQNWTDYLMYSLTLISAGGMFYYFFDLKNANLLIFLNLLSLPIIGLFTWKFFKKDNSISENYVIAIKNYLSEYKIKKENLLDYLGAGLYLVMLAILIYTAYQTRTGEALRSFWQLLPKYWLLLYFLSTVWLICGNFYRKHSGWRLLNILHVNFTLALAFIIYRFGYGFDPFIHQATEQAIFTDGIINPKQPYYAGYYALTVILAKLFGNLPSFWDKLMIFIAFNGVTLPFFWNWLKKLNSQNYGWLLILFFLIPFSLFISPTPQAMANLFSLALIFALLSENVHWLNQAGLMAAILLIHPLSGIPIFFFCLFWNSKNKVLKIINFIALSVALPLVFLIQGKLSGLTSWQWDNQKFIDFFVSLKTQWPLRYQIWKDSAYTLIAALPILAMLISAVLVWKRKSFAQWENIKKLFDGIFALLICYLLTLPLNFPALIYYEQNNYSQRILYLIAYLFLALAIIALNKFFSLNAKKIYYLPLLLALTGIITVNVYQSYPRDDQYHLDRGYNTSAVDFSAVGYVQENADKNITAPEATTPETSTSRESGTNENIGTNAAAPATFAVLAPQSVGAAALQQYGFYHQIENVAGEKIYYYSIPTGGALYQHYLKIVYEDQSREYLQSIFNDYKIDQIFIVIPHYWHNAPAIIANLKNSTDEWVELDGGKIYIFKINKNLN
jgi:MFS family permease